MMRTWSVAECSTLDKEGLAKLGNGFPAGFDSPCDFKDALPKTASQMQDDQIKLFEGSLAGEGSDPRWSPPTALAAQSWWHSHNNMAAVQWAVALHGLPVEASALKKDNIQLLLDYQAPPIPWKQLEFMAAAWYDMSAEERKKVSGTPPAPAPPRYGTALQLLIQPWPPVNDNGPSQLGPLPGGGPGIQHPIAALGPPLGSAVPRQPLNTGPPGGGTGLSSSGPPDGSSGGSSQVTDAVTSMAEVLAKACDIIRDKAAAEADTAKVPEDAVEKVLEKMRRSLRNNEYLDIMYLSANNLDKLRFKGGTDVGTALSLVNGVLTATDQSQNDITNSYDWKEFRSAWNMLMMLMMGMPDMLPRVQDRMRWFQLLESYRNVHDNQRTKYAKLFMYRYKDEVLWEKFFHTDSSLLLQYLPASSVSPQFNLGDAWARGKTRESSRRENDRNHGGGRSSAGKRHRSRSPRRSGGKNSRSRAPQKRHKYCFTRADPLKGECSHGSSCRFDHNCASCGGQHSAATCPAWDQAKADRNLK
jgi:hypothetical protein